MKSWTVDEMLALRPCSRYDGARIEALWAGRERLSLLDILRLDIPPEDRIWVATRLGALASDLLARWRDETIERAMRLYRPWIGQLLVGTDAWSEWAATGAGAVGSVAEVAAERKQQIAALIALLTEDQPANTERGRE